MSILVYYAAIKAGQTPGQTAAPGFRVRDAVGALLAEFAEPDNFADPGWSIDLASLGLTAGEHVLQVSRVNAFGCESLAVEVAVSVDQDGDAAPQVRQPRSVALQQGPAGALVASWMIQDSDADRADPDSFELAYRGAESTLVLAVTFDRQLGRYRADLPAVTDGSTVEVGVRSRIGDNFGPWVYSLPVVADAAGPSAPSLVAVPSGSC